MDTDSIGAENFRPNLLVGGRGCPHQEDTWKSISIPYEAITSVNDFDSNNTAKFIELTVTKPCSRCLMVNVSKHSGNFDCRVFQTLLKYRKNGKDVNFGQFLEITRERDDSSVVAGDLREELTHIISVGTTIRTEQRN